MHAKLLHSSPTLCDLMDSSPPGSSVQGILEARILEWVAMLGKIKVCLQEEENPVEIINIRINKTC